MKTLMKTIALIVLLCTANLLSQTYLNLTQTDTELQTAINNALQQAFKDSDNVAVPMNGVTSLRITKDASLLEDGSASTGTDILNNNTWEAVKFTSTSTATGAKMFSLKIKNDGTISNPTAYFTGYVYSDNAGVPNVSVTAAWTYTYYGNITSSYVEYFFSINGTLTLGNDYWLILKRSAASTGANIYFDGTNTGDNSFAYSSDGSSWSVKDTTFWFKIYDGSIYTIYGESDLGAGVYGYSMNNYGIRGHSLNDAGGIFNSVNNLGLTSTSTYNIGIIGQGDKNAGVYGLSTSGYGIIGRGGVVGVRGVGLVNGIGGTFEAADATKYAIEIPLGRVGLPLSNTPTTPTLCFGDYDTGFYESADDNLIAAFAGNASWLWTRNYFGSNEYTGGAIRNINATSTVPTITPHNGDSNTGLGAATANDSMSVITGGAERINVSNTKVSISNKLNLLNIPSDSTVCVTGDLWFNSTTGAIHRKF